MVLTINLIIKCLGAILVAIILGNGGVYFFNKMPAKWFCDYGETPSEEKISPYSQRIKSYPWKPLFTMFFVAAGIWLVKDDISFALAGVLTMWIMLEISISDILYHIIPNQLVILLIITTVGYYPYYDSWKSCALGALVGFGIMICLALFGKLIYRRETLGGGDIKLFTTLGFILGPYGIIAVFIGSTLLSAAHFSLLLARRRIKKDQSMAMAPYMAISTSIYILFLWGRPEALLGV